MQQNGLPGSSPPASGIASALRRSRMAFIGVALFSALINVLALTGALYMLQIYDRVLPSHSVPTLIGLTAILLGLYAGYGALDLIRTRLLARIGLRLDRTLRDRVYDTVLSLPIRTRHGAEALQPVRDLDQVRGFLSGAGPIALFDLPWMPVYVAFVYLLHPWLGMLAGAGALLLVVLTLLTEARTRKPSQTMAEASAKRGTFGEASRRSAESIRALGMSGRMNATWSSLNEAYLDAHLRAVDAASTYGTLSKVLRLLLQSAVLGLGAYLAIRGESTAGAMIAASIMTARALAPVEIAIANWKSFVSARQGARRLKQFFAAVPVPEDVMPLPAPTQSLSVEQTWVAAPGQQKPILQNVSFALKAGDGLGVIGPSASGKSTLARALVGAWLAKPGTIRIDGAALEQWNPDALGRHIGYLPQELALLDGTVCENIARFDPEATEDSVIPAARLAGVHEMILRLPEGYNTKIGSGHHLLSIGQQQRIALARALYGDPFLVVLDEPNSNLDADGEVALSRAIAAVRQRNGIVVVIAHRPAALAQLDQVLLLADGQVRAFGPRDEVLKNVLQAVAPAAAAQAGGRLKVISDAAPAGS